MKAKMLNKMEKLQAMFPEMWFKNGDEFYEKESNFIWTGEGSCVEGDYAFDMYGYGETMGVHPKLENALKKLGLWAEFYDAGTVFIFED